MVYRIGYTTNDVDERIASYRLNENLHNILEAVGATKYQIYLSDSVDNFRLKLFPQYKANRKQPKPVHLSFLSNYIVDHWGAEIAWGEEADDALGIHQDDTTIICSIDKDLLQIPGKHFNWVNGNYTTVSESMGLFRFYQQILVGDSTDNITSRVGLRCPGIGPEKSAKLLEGCTNEDDYFQAVCDAYRRSLPDLGVEALEARMLLTGQLVKIRQEKEEIWNFPSKPNYTVVSPQ